MDWSLKVVIYIKTIVYVLPKDLVSHEDNHCNKQSNKYGILMHLKAGVQQWKFPTPEGGDFRNQVHMIVSPFNCQRGGMIMELKVVSRLKVSITSTKEASG